MEHSLNHCAWAMTRMTSVSGAPSRLVQHGAFPGDASDHTGLARQAVRTNKRRYRRRGPAAAAQWQCARAGRTMAAGSAAGTRSPRRRTVVIRWAACNDPSAHERRGTSDCAWPDDVVPGTDPRPPGRRCCRGFRCAGRQPRAGCSSRFEARRRRFRDVPASGRSAGSVRQACRSYCVPALCTQRRDAHATQRCCSWTRAARTAARCAAAAGHAG